MMLINALYYYKVNAGPVGNNTLCFVLDAVVNFHFDSDSDQNEYSLCYLTLGIIPKTFKDFFLP